MSEITEKKEYINYVKNLLALKLTGYCVALNIVTDEVIKINKSQKENICKQSCDVKID